MVGSCPSAVSMANKKSRLNIYYIIRSVLDKIHKNGILYCIIKALKIILCFLRYRIKMFFNSLENLYTIIFPSRGYVDSVLAIYDFSANPFTFNFVEFLARAEVFRVKHSLSYIDLVFVVDREKKHRGDQPEVTDSNYRNWILNLAESAEPLKSISSISIFDDKHKFLSFYHKARYTHKIYPQTGAVYRSQACYHLKYVSDYYRATGFSPKFESSGILLDWAEKYFLEKSYPLLPVIVFVRNSDTQSTRNTVLPVWFDFFRQVICRYPVKFFLINDFWNPINIPADLVTKVVISTEATISAKYRAALTQRASLVMSVNTGSFMYIYFTDTPYLVFGLNNDVFSAEFNLTEHGLNDDLRFPWATKYQRVFCDFGDTGYIFSRFEELHSLLKNDNRFVPDYYNLKHKEETICRSL